VSARVATILVTPIKGLRVQPRSEVLVGPGGVAEDRRFLLLDSSGRMVNGKRLGELQALRAEYLPEEPRLEIVLPDGTLVSGAPRAGRRATARFFSSEMAVREVEGPWSQAISEHVGEPLRLVESDLEAGAVDRGAAGAVSLVSTATLARLARAAGIPTLDGRRLRMLFEIDGVDAHEEDAWLARPLRVGEAIVTLGGHVGRCIVTTRDPQSGERDLATLDALAGYRRDAQTTEPLACGVYGEVNRPGLVRVGDAVELV
jgi:uncharacterized protein YcbX